MLRGLRPDLLDPVALGGQHAEVHMAVAGVVRLAGGAVPGEGVFRHASRSGAVLGVIDRGLRLGGGVENHRDARQLHGVVRPLRPDRWKRRSPAAPRSWNMLRLTVRLAPGEI